MQPSNIPKLIAEGHVVRVCVYCLPHEMPILADRVKHLGAPLEFHPFEIAPEHRDRAVLRAVQASCLLQHAERCMAEDAFLIPASSVTLWADGSLYNVFKVCEETDCATACIYLLAEGDTVSRELPDDAFALSTPWSAPELASLTFDHLHFGSRSTLNRDTSMCHLTGLGIQQLSPTLFAARIQVPSVACIKFKPEDVALLKLENDFRFWDSWFPAQLIRDGRYTFLASSELAYQVNLMRPGKMREETYRTLDAECGALRDRRFAARATMQAEHARGFMSSIRTSRPVQL